jgi:hypothetical protein
MAHPPLGLGRRLRLPEEFQGASVRGGQPAGHHPLGIRRLQGRAGSQAFSLGPPSLPAPALGQLELAQRKLGLGGVSLVRLHPGNSFGLRGHGGCTALRLRDGLNPKGRVRKKRGGQGVLRREGLKGGGTPRRHTVRRQKEKRLRGGGGKVRGGKSSEAAPETTLKGGPEVEAGSRISLAPPRPGLAEGSSPAETESASSRSASPVPESPPGEPEEDRPGPCPKGNSSSLDPDPEPSPGGEGGRPPDVGGGSAGLRPLPASPRPTTCSLAGKSRKDHTGPWSAMGFTAALQYWPRWAS